MEESGGLNLYGFVGNDGIGTFDYLGMCDVLTGDVIGSGVAGAVYGFVESRVKKRLLKAAITAIPVVGEIIAGGVVAWDVVSGGIAIGKLAVNRDAITDRIKEIFEDPDLEMWFDCIPQADCVRLSFLLGQVFGDSILGGKGLKASTIKAHNKVKDFVRKLKGGGKKKALSRLNDSDTVKPATEPNVDPTDVGPGSATKTGQSWFDDVARNATRNADSSKLVLGKYLEDGKSYTKVAAHYKATYFKVENWGQVTKGLSQDEIWQINETFLRQQIQQGKQIILSHNPATATGFFAKEVGYLESLGYKFVQENWVWKAVR